MTEEVLTRSEILGRLIQDARLSAGRSAEECAEVLGRTPSDFESLESGSLTPSLPELEVLAVFLKVPMAHFWGKARVSKQPDMNSSEYLTLRRMMIGAVLGQERMRARLSVDELAEATGISSDTLAKYESGAIPIPYFELETLSAKLNASIKIFVDDEFGPLAENEAERQLEERFEEWSPRMKMFIADSRNHAYIETAMRLSEMDAERLRSIAEGILEITL